MSKVRLILSVKKFIRGKETMPGAILLEGECTKGMTVADINKAIQLREAQAIETAPETKKT